MSEEKKIDDGGPAFPHTVKNDDGTYFACESGISIRDWFAGQALAGLLSHSFEDGSDFLHETGPDAAAYQAYRMADAMLAARKAGDA